MVHHQLWSQILVHAVQLKPMIKHIPGLNGIDNENDY